MEERILDLSDLPEQARIEVQDFYEFVKQKYGKSENRVNWSRLIPRQVPSFEPMTREEIYER